ECLRRFVFLRFSAFFLAYLPISFAKRDLSSSRYRRKSSNEIAGSLLNSMRRSSYWRCGSASIARRASRATAPPPPSYSPATSIDARLSAHRSVTPRIVAGHVSRLSASCLFHKSADDRSRSICETIIVSATVTMGSGGGGQTAGGPSG